MASLHHSSIDRLSNDLLWDIFLANALDTALPTFSDGNPWFGPGTRWTRLNVARSTSQVCLRWRNIMLHSPSLWARLLDSDDFGRDTRWMEEVVTRTGLENVPLWIQHSNLYADWWRDSSPRYQVISNIILGLLDSRWEGIERLNLSLKIYDEDLQDARWKNLFSLGTSVQHFSVDINRLPNCLALEHPPSSFSSGPTMRNVRTLCLFNAAFSLTRALYLLRDMPLLTSLELGRYEEKVVMAEAPQLPPLESLHLPRLEEIRLRNILGEAIILLPRIIGAPFCKLNLVSTGVETAFTCNKEDIAPFEKALERFAQGRLSSPVPSGTHGKTIGLQLRDNSMSFTISTDTRKPEDEEKVRRHDFKIEIDSFNGVIHQQLPRWLGDAITRAILSCRAPTRDDLFVLHVYDLNPNYVDWKTPNLAPFILSFDIVESLVRITDKAIQGALNSAEANVRAGEMFPTVNKLSYEHKPNIGVQPENDVPLLYQAVFLQDVSVRQSSLLYTYPKATPNPHNLAEANEIDDSRQLDDLISALLRMKARGN